MEFLLYFPKSVKGKPCGTKGQAGFGVKKGAWRFENSRNDA